MAFSLVEPTHCVNDSGEIRLFGGHINVSLKPLGKWQEVGSYVRQIIPPAERVKSLYQWRRNCSFWSCALIWGQRDRQSYHCYIYKADSDICSGPVNFFLKQPNGHHHNDKIQIPFHCLPVWPHIPLSFGPMSPRHARYVSWHFINFEHIFIETFAKCTGVYRYATQINLQSICHSFLNIGKYLQHL